jgi:hypothetical protein
LPLPSQGRVPAEIGYRAQTTSWASVFVIETIRARERWKNRLFVTAVTHDTAASPFMNALRDRTILEF